MAGVIDSLERAQLRRVPRFSAGDRVKVHFQVIEGTRRRTQVFEGVVLKRQGHGARETFTVRKQSFGVGVERTFPVHSPKIERIEVAARGDVRRAKLYYLRDRVGKRARVRERSYSGPEQAVQPGLMHEPSGATDADGVTVEDAPVEAAAPEVAADAPEVAADAPEVAADAPEVAADAPEVTPDAPEGAADAPEVAAEVPEVATGGGEGSDGQTEAEGRPEAKPA